MLRLLISYRHKYKHRLKISLFRVNLTGVTNAWRQVIKLCKLPLENTLSIILLKFARVHARADW